MVHIRRQKDGKFKVILSYIVSSRPIAQNKRGRDREVKTDRQIGRRERKIKPVRREYTVTISTVPDCFIVSISRVAEQTSFLTLSNSLPVGIMYSVLMKPFTQMSLEKAPLLKMSDFVFLPFLVPWLDTSDPASWKHSPALVSMTPYYISVIPGLIQLLPMNLFILHVP